VQPPRTAPPRWAERRPGLQRRTDRPAYHCLEASPAHCPSDPADRQIDGRPGSRWPASRHRPARSGADRPPPPRLPGRPRRIRRPVPRQEGGRPRPAGARPVRRARHSPGSQAAGSRRPAGRARTRRQPPGQAVREAPQRLPWPRSKPVPDRKAGPAAPSRLQFYRRLVRPHRTPAPPLPPAPRQPGSPSSRHLVPAPEPGPVTPVRQSRVQGPAPAADRRGPS
jgi:hypothetical protein